MRFVFTLLCMGLIVIAAAVLVAVEAFIKLLPLLVVVAAVVVVLRFGARRRSGSPATVSSSAVVNVPDAAAFHAQGSSAGRAVAARPAAAYQGSQPMAGEPDGWMVVPVWRDRAPYPQSRNVIDAEVIEEDHQHG